MDLALAGRRPPRRPLRRAQPEAQPGVHGDRRAVPGHRHRGQRGPLLARGPGPLPPPARQRTGAARPHRLEGQLALGQPRQLQPDVVPDLPRPAKSKTGSSKASSAARADGEPRDRGGGEAGAGRGRDRLRLVLPGARGEPGAGPAPPGRRRRRAGRASGGRALARVLAQGLRRRAGRRRPQGAGQQLRDDGDRRRRREVPRDRRRRDPGAVDPGGDETAGHAGMGSAPRTPRAVDAGFRPAPARRHRGGSAGGPPALVQVDARRGHAARGLPAGRPRSSARRSSPRRSR